MTTLQAYLLSKSALLFPSIRPLHLSPLHISCHSLSTFARPLKFPIGCCTLHPEQQHHRDDANFSSDSNPVSIFDVGDIPTKFDNPVAPVDDNGSLTMEGQNQNEGLVNKVGRLPIVVVLVGLWAMVKRGVGRISLSGWMTWWPWPWHQGKRLDRLIAEADANPNDAAKQSALLAELNKHSCRS